MLKLSSLLILLNYKGVYGVAGTAETTPFAISIAAAQQAERTLLKSGMNLDMKPLVSCPNSSPKSVMPQVDVSNNAAISLIASHGVNLALNENAIALRAGADRRVDSPPGETDNM